MSTFARLRRRADRRLYRRLHALFRSVFPGDVPPGPLPPARVRRVLVGRSDRVGDAVVLTPALSYLRAVLPPDAEIDVVQGGGAALLRDDPRVARVYVPASGLRRWLRQVRELRARRYDVVLSVRLHDHLSEGLMAALVAPRTAVRATIRRPTQHAGLFTHQRRLRRDERHILTRLLVLAQSAVADHGARPTPDLVRYPASLAASAGAVAAVDALAAAWDHGPFVAMNAWGTDPKRCFGVALGAEIAARIAARHPELTVVLTPPPDRAEEADAMARAACASLAGSDRGTPGDGTHARATARVVVAPPSSDLRQLVALIRRAAAVLTPDTANMHIASAVGTPLVAVYTSYTATDIWRAWGTQPQRILHLPGRGGIAEATAEQIADAFDALWAELPAPTGTQPPAHALHA